MSTNNGHDNFFEELANSKPYCKFAFEGFAGSGKTYTMVQLAIGLHKRIGSTKPVIAFDTEEALQALKPEFDAAGIRVLRKSSRSLADLMETMRRCRDGASDVLLIDSISHIWEDALNAYMKKKNRSRLQFEDWGVIKPTWKREFSEPFVRDPYHCIMAGRAAFEYEDEKTEDEHGKVRREIFKSGIKMKVEGETAYEPDMLILMERCEDVVAREKKIWREATIIKDRSTLIDGRTFKNPSFDDFAPAVDRLLANPEYKLPQERSAADLFTSEDDRRQYAIARDILLEKIEGEMVSAWPGQTAQAKSGKVDALLACFGTRSWTEVTKMPIPVLEGGLLQLVERCGRARTAQQEAAAS